LSLDADEALSPALAEEIRSVVSRPPERVKSAGFYINRVLIFMGREIRHCGYFPSWNLRLFKRGMARYDTRAVHEHMLADGKTSRLKKLILHEDRRGLEHFIAKHNRYSTLEAWELYRQSHRWPGFKAFYKDGIARRRWIKYGLAPRLAVPWMWRFVYMYLLRGGIFDRRAGLHLCLFISSYEFFIRAKYMELLRLKGGAATSVEGLAVPEGKIQAIGVAAGTTTAGALRADVTANVGTANIQTKDALKSDADDRRSDSARSTRSSDSASSTANGPNGDSATGRRPPKSAAHAPRAGKAPVSVLIPTLNEASNLARCLDHLQWADEVVVVDSRSKDATRQIAEKYGAVVVDFQWDGKWPKKKNWALRNAPFKNEWVLIVDADEWITPELADDIRRAVQSETNVGYYVNRRFIFMGGWIRHCGYYPSWNLRLIRRGFGEYERLTDVNDTGSGDNEVHEHVHADGPVGHLEHDMLHFAFPSINVFMEKHNRYSNWEAAVQFKALGQHEAVASSSDLSMRRRIKNFSRRLPFRPTLRFIYSYILKGGFLDGQPGYVFCRLLAIYEFLSVAKYQELRRAENDKLRERQLSPVPPMRFEDLKTGGVKPDIENSADAKSADGKPADGKPADGKPADAKSADEKSETGESIRVIDGQKVGG
jgi:glycosyltransferase involved in cell wall biosynthesis